MFKFVLKGQAFEVKTQVYVPHAGERIWTKTFQYDNDVEAALIYKLFNDSMWNKLENIRREAYQQGWADAKGKRSAKRDWFSGSWDA